MQETPRKSDAVLGVNIFISATLHIAAFLTLAWIQGLSPDLGSLKTTYYVDIVNLPVASPRAGAPTPAPNRTEETSSAPDTGPVLPPSTKGQPSANAKVAAEKQFQERMAKLEGKAEEQRQAAAIESLRQKVAGGQAGMPTGTGNQAGSDYTAYIHSRLKDAFKETIAYQSKAPFVIVKLYITSEGRISRVKQEKSSGDKMFETAVLRAITLAEKNFVPPPGRSSYEGLFVFKPQGVAQK